MDWRVLGFILFVTFLTAVLCGLAPALNSIRSSTNAGMREGNATVSSQRLRWVLLAAQVALCTILISGTALLIRSVDQVRQETPGFEFANVVLVPTGLATSGAGDEQARPLLRELAERIKALPGVEDVAWTNTIPMGDVTYNTGIPHPRTQEQIPVGFGAVSSDFFQTLGIPMRAGRDFSAADAVAGNAIVLSEAAAERFWPGENAIGKTLQWRRPWEVVGVVRNFNVSGYGSEAMPYVWIPSAGTVGSRILVRHSGSAEPLLNDLPEIARSLDRRFLPVPVRYTEIIAEAERSYRLSATIGSMLGGLCLLLACIGIYGVAAYNVAQRTREVGIRMALGAKPRSVLVMILKQNLRPVIVGTAVGIASSQAFGRILTSFLYGVTPGDFQAMLATIAILSATSVLAVWGPARRASRVDSTVTLRHE